MKLNHKGFTLIEIAVVLIIVGLLIGFGASMVRPLFERSRRIETQESVKAVVELKPGENLTSEEVVQAVVDRIAAFKKPRQVEFVDSLPRTPEDEIDRQSVKASYG